MTEKLSDRMKALTTLAKYSNRITLHISDDLLKENCNLSEELNKNIECLKKDKRNDTIVLKDYWDDTQTIIDTKVKL